MKRLILKLSWLLVPTLAAVYGFPFLVLGMSGELTSASSVARRQRDADVPILYGPSYSNPVKPLKLNALLYRAPTVAVFGTSRVMQFRSEMFRNPGEFYNAGGAAPTIWDLRALLAEVPEHAQPQVLIVGLDQYLFNANFAEFTKMAVDPETSWRGIVQNSRWTVYEDYRARKFRVRSLFSRRSLRGVRVGLNAIANNNGFRNDGSYHYGAYIADPRNPAHGDLDFADSLRRIGQGTQRFEYGRHVSTDAVEELAAFLRICRGRGIHVVALLPPYAHTVYTRMMSMGARYGYLRELRARLTPVFEEYGYPLFDFSDLEWVGATDVETIDGFHASEPAYVRMLLEMQRRDDALRAHVMDPDALEARLRGASPYVVFETGSF